jgi:hypothetical protein
LRYPERSRSAAADERPHRLIRDITRQPAPPPTFPKREPKRLVSDAPSIESFEAEVTTVASHESASFAL